MEKFSHRLLLFCKATVYTMVSGCLVLWLAFWYFSGTPTGLFKFILVYYVSENYYMNQTDRKNMFEGALKGIINSLGEPHTKYLSQSEYMDIIKQTESSYSCIGIYLGDRGKGAEVISPIEDSPAEKSGIKKGDLIIAVDNKDTSGMNISQISKMLLGQEDTSVVLRIRRGETEQDFTILRKKITLPTVKGKMMEGEIGYIRITQFAEKTGTDFAQVYNELEQKGMKKLILDLRSNPGGLLTTTKQIGSFILPKGPIFSIRSKSGKTDVYESDGLKENIPLVVLVDEGSASASEIIAGAVQDLKRGILVGTKTYGKGTVQTIIPSLDDEGIAVTIAKYHTPNDRVIDATGIEPDVVVTLTEDDIAIMNDRQLDKALEILRD